MISIGGWRETAHLRSPSQVHERPVENAVPPRVYPADAADMTLDENGYPTEPYSEVVPGVFQADTTYSPVELLQQGFDAVFDLCGLDRSGGVADGTYVAHPIDDVPWISDPNAIHELGIRVAEHVRRGSRVAVNCMSGLNRSGLLVGRALIALGYSPAEALALIRKARGPHALSNRQFVRFLLIVCPPRGLGNLTPCTGARCRWRVSSWRNHGMDAVVQSFSATPSLPGEAFHGVFLDATGSPGLRADGVHCVEHVAAEPAFPRRSANLFGAVGAEPESSRRAGVRQRRRDSVKAERDGGGGTSLSSRACPLDCVPMLPSRALVGRFVRAVAAPVLLGVLGVLVDPNVVELHVTTQAPVRLGRARVPRFERASRPRTVVPVESRSSDHVSMHSLLDPGLLSEVPKHDGRNKAQRYEEESNDKGGFAVRIKPVRKTGDAEAFGLRADVDVGPARDKERYAQTEQAEQHEHGFLRHEPGIGSSRNPLEHG